jgi:aminoglycoside 3-N-acetyltransferase
MPEKDVVAATGEPATVATLVRDLRRLGVLPGSTLLVHSSLSSLGWVAGGAHAVVLALGEAVGPDGTVVLPTHSTALSDPSRWEQPPVPESWWETVRNETPSFDPRVTPTRGMGAIADTFRSQEHVIRSDHPQASFAARGPRAAFVTSDHALDGALGERSPLARVYDVDGCVLLLGVGYDRNTSLHLCEYRASFPSKKTVRQGAPISIAGERRWVEFEDLEWDDSDFTRLGADFEAGTDAVTVGAVGVGESRLMRQRALVDYGVAWMERNRS